MKFLIAFALFAVASAGVIPPAVIASENPEIQEIVAAIQSPSTDPATAAALEQLLLQVLGLAEPEPIAVGPALVDNEEPISIGPAIVDEYEPISVGPALIDFPLPDGGAVTEVHPAPVMPAPVGPSAKAPLVQIILNIQSSSDVAVESIPSPAPTPVQIVDDAGFVPEPVIVDRPIVPEFETVEEKPIIPTPVIVVDKPEVPESVIVVDKPTVSEPIVPEPIVPEPIVPEPVIIVDQPTIPEPVIIAQPIIPAPAIVLPEILN
ncbi:unnamed protein product, partial [Iphiclides podalirius]